MDESAHACAFDRCYRAARIIASQIERRASAPSDTFVFPILRAHLPPPAPLCPPRRYMRRLFWSPLYVRRESPFSVAPSLLDNDTTNNCDFSSSCRSRYCYVRTNTRRHSMPWLSHGIFCERKKIILSRGRERNRARRCIILFRVTRAWKRKWEGGLCREGGWKNKRERDEDRGGSARLTVGS